ncbi:NAD(P)/FAD-dependent oxidoreductase [Aureivirga sp. CE67]|uniref:NAD(P)/FAD-dependent oxidoreductase n=1 Tax=Aureivirga sp. CE67 TaxID=1788983 RepID=UPI0018C97F7B|nr:FAD-dependent oxidoreductase [Aureivirga sp. CE67]
MPTTIRLQVAPEVAANEELLKKHISKLEDIPLEEITAIDIVKRSIDARQRAIKINLNVEIYRNEVFEEKQYELPDYEDVSNKREVIVVGAGPAGLFAALRLIEKGLKPIVLERGKDVRARRRDLAAITKFHIVDEDSNYCFGEGGAGTYSDGKLYTRSKKRGDVQRILHLLVAHGATQKIMVEAHPHIGTNKLPKIIQEIRENIIRFGGEVRFETRVKDILIKNNKVTGVETQNGDIIESDQVILATGHSARDIFELLHHKGILIEAKPFALGVRVEHSQELIDKIQYKAPRGQFLPPAPYSIVKQVLGRGVYSFCMCPGGVIAPCATAPGEVVTNGWSPSKRDRKTSNSGIVVELRQEDFQKYKEHGPLAGMYFQKEIEQKAWSMGGETQKVPAQRLVDFTKGKKSNFIPETSYMPGTTSVDLGGVLPEFVHKTLQGGFVEFGKSMRGYMTNEAVVHAPESRTSSPVRIPRTKETLEHPVIKGLFPCGEGAGYAGGIISAAIDGEKCAEKCAETFGN